MDVWLVVYGLSQLLARVNPCGKIFGSWWLVGMIVLARGGSWWLVVGRGGSCVVLESTEHLQSQCNYRPFIT